MVVVEIDERGAQRYGLWPWPRDVVAKAIDELLDADAKVMGLDMPFTDETNGQRARAGVAAGLRRQHRELPEAAGSRSAAELEQRAGRSPDAVLEAVLRKGGPRVVQGVIPFGEEDVARFAPSSAPLRRRSAQGRGDRPPSPGSVKGSTKSPLDAVEAYRLRSRRAGAPAALRRQRARRYGHFGTDPDLDGTIRRSPHLVQARRSPQGLLPVAGAAGGGHAARRADRAVIEDGELGAIAPGAPRPATW